MRYILLLSLFLVLNCSDNKTILLPEIENAAITTITDVSPAYVFYDENQLDSTLLNRKNLISTTNWLVNVDKRLTLKQAIPQIKYLQDKKRNAKMHKNESAKNYFTCNDTGIKNLGFIEFTEVIYNLTELNSQMINVLELTSEDFKNNTSLIKDIPKSSILINQNHLSDFKNKIKKRIQWFNQLEYPDDDLKITEYVLALYFDQSLSFQDYISIKSILSNIELGKIRIDSNEFIY